MAVLTLTAAEFKTDFPEFSDAVKYPDSIITILIGRAKCYIDTNCSRMNADCLKYAWELMVAHLQTIKSRIAEGQTAVGQIASTSIDSISVSLVAPTNKDSFDYWLNQTPYGQELLALLQSAAPAGLYFGGSRQRVL